MYAGAAVYSAIQRAAVRSADCVGILGMGGLGHLAIQFVASMGCQVVVFSTSADKKLEAFSYGAHEFYSSEEMVNKDAKEPVDCMLVISGKCQTGRMCFLGYGAELLSVP
jgi:D-arabinose 1-dehydrogenase-like Zn-dependent alcohol dehydrogenase